MVVKNIKPEKITNVGFYGSPFSIFCLVLMKKQAQHYASSVYILKSNFTGFTIKDNNETLIQSIGETLNPTHITAVIIRLSPKGIRSLNIRITINDLTPSLKLPKPICAIFELGAISCQTQPIIIMLKRSALISASAIPLYPAG